MRLIFLGAPGSGKGTQAQKFVKDFGIVQLSTGDMLRKAVAGGTEIGQRAAAVMESGQLVADEIMIGIIRERLAAPDCANGYLLDGFPRTVAQAEKLDELLAERKEGIDAAIYLMVADDLLLRRITGRRVHLPSGRVYHVEFNPPRIPGKDDVSGEVLTHRKDDTEETDQGTPGRISRTNRTLDRLLCEGRDARKGGRGRRNRRNIFPYQKRCFPLRRGEPLKPSRQP